MCAHLLKVPTPGLSPVRCWCVALYSCIWWQLLWCLGVQG